MNPGGLCESGPKKPLAIIVDLDETLCTQFDVPVEAGVGVLRRIDERKIQVHYVTARTAVCRDATERFVGVHRLPGSRNVHYCPMAIGSLDHKRRQHESLGREFDVIASIGDSFEEEQAAMAARIPFYRVDPCSPADQWILLAARIAGLGGFKS